MRRFRKRIVVYAGLFLIGFAGIWALTVTPRFKRRIGPDWSWQATFIGTMTYADPHTGKFPSKDPVALCERHAHVLSTRASPETVLIQDSYVIRDSLTGKKAWEYRYSAPVDPFTGKHESAKYSGDYYVFPRSAQKQTYRLRFNYLKGVPLAFQGEEEIEGIPTYVFGYKGRGEYTEAYAGTDEYEGVPLKPGQEIRCADDQFQFRVWVEPVTGELLKLEESCVSGDYVYDVATNRQLAAVARWSGVTAGDDVLLRADTVRRQKQLYLWMVSYVPWILAAAGSLLIACDFVWPIRQSPPHV